MTIASPADLLIRARAAPLKPVVACVAPEDEVVLASIAEAAKAGLMRPLLIGNVAIIRNLAAEVGFDLEEVPVVDEPDWQAAADQGVAMCRAGEAHALMKGSAPTGLLLSAVVNRTFGLTTGRALSHAALFAPTGYDRALLLSDAGVNVAPDPDRQVDIIKNCVGLWRALGLPEPKVALLAAIEYATPKMPVTATIKAVLSLSARRSVGALIGGPYSLDVAIDPEAAAGKGMDDSIAGRADILIAPDIEAGNLLYKALTCFAGLDVASIVIGATVPLIVTSRSDSRTSKLSSIALGVLMANAATEPASGRSSRADAF